MKDFAYCQKCLFPNTKPDLYFSDDGVCDACISAERKNGKEAGIDWVSRAQEFDQLIAATRAMKGGVYDCVIPVSGGKDSTWQVYAAKNLHDLHPLAVTFDQFDSGELGRYDLEVLRQIGVDHVHFTLNPKVVKNLVRKGFE
ncbi:MAG: N-acetyl sugar amidotransferase, partial [Gammaproteobacteria bacterium]